MPAPDADIRKTMRLDLTEGLAGTPVAPRKPVDGANLTRMNWSAASKVPTYVKEKSQYQELLQSIYDAALITSTTGRIVDTNVRAIEFLKYERLELMGLAIFDVIAGADATLIETLFNNLEHERFTLIQAYCVRKDGTTFPAEIAVNKLRLDQVRLSFFIRDISVRVQAEELLRREHVALQNAQAGIATTDTHGILDVYNPAFAALLGLDAHALEGHDIRPLLGNGEAIHQLIELVLKDPRTWMNEIALHRATDNAMLHLQVYASPVISPEEQTTGIAFSLVDVTAQRVAETELARLKGAP